jgi:citrate lyase beta subunit
MLFVPGSRPDRFSKAAASGADIICLDLEDAVLPADKAVAREHVLAYLGQSPRPCEVAVRINSLRSREGLEDLLALATVTAAPDLVVLPKTECAGEVTIVAAVLAQGGHAAALVPMVETLAGLDNVASIAAARHVAFVFLGTADLSTEMGVTMDWEPMLYARQQVVQAAKSARVEAMDGVWAQIDDLEGCAAETRRSVALGFAAKPCLHPKQVDVIHKAMLPAPGELELARGIVAAFENGGAGAILYRGRMIDAPIYEAACRKIAAWDRETGASS